MITDSEAVADLAHQLAPPPVTGSNGTPDLREVSEPGRDVGDLAVEMRTMVTPVIGYLELISQERRPISADQHLHWIETIEKRLEAIQGLNDQIARTCAVLRESVNDSEAAPPRGPEAPGD
jgi:signal transduction histidine kinase